MVWEDTQADCGRTTVVSLWLAMRYMQVLRQPLLCEQMYWIEIICSFQTNNELNSADLKIKC